MKKLFVMLGIVAMLGVSAFAQPRTDRAVNPPFPGILKNARYVYVMAMDGPETSADLYTEDRQAISEVQTALKEWGKYIVVYNPGEADMILRVQRRGNEDVLAVYQPGNSIYLWRVMGRGGLDHNELPFFAQMRDAVEKLGSRFLVR